MIYLIKSYRVEGDMVILIVPYKETEFECLIDLDDLDKVKNLPLNIIYRKNIDNYYVGFTEYLGTTNGKPKYRGRFLHNYLLSPEGGMVVDHISQRDTLDNRRCNLRTVSNVNNSKNRKSKNSNNKSGYRNVFWCNTSKKWVVSLQVNKKAVRIGSFDDVDEAGQAADEARKKYYGEFAGKS